MSSTRINLAWRDNATSETGFEIHRSTAGSGGPFTLLARRGANVTSYSNTGLSPSKRYCYKVRAVGGTTLQPQYSAFSNTSCASTPRSFISVSADDNHACGVTATATYCWGANDYGKLGDGTTIQRLTPVRAAGNLSLASASTGTLHTCGLTPKHSAYCWGFNGTGGLGDGTTTLQRLTPVPVSGNHSFAALSGGHGSTCGVTTTGVAYCWGYNKYGQLGDGTTTQRSTPRLVSGGLSIVNISVGGMGRALGLLEGQHTCAVAAGGAAYCWGYNGYGRLGDGTFTNRLRPVRVKGGLTFTSVSAGANHTCGVTTAGRAYCWGDGYAIDGTGNSYPTPKLVAGGLSFTSVSAGGIHTCGLTTGGVAYCWGTNNNGQLGDGTTNQRLTPVAVAGGLRFIGISAGGYYTCAVTGEGIAYCWGSNVQGALGDGTTTDRYRPTRVH
jgi:alpha-tubulin suppressor-like RCC1 family protein